MGVAERGGLLRRLFKNPAGGGCSRDEINERDWWLKMSTPFDVALSSDGEITRPLSCVVEIKKAASKIHILQINQFTEEDRKAGKVIAIVPKDSLLCLSEETKSHLCLTDFIPADETAEVFVSARSVDVFLGVRTDERIVKLSFNSKVNSLSLDFIRLHDGCVVVDKRKTTNNLDDFNLLLSLFRERWQLNSRARAS